MTKEEVKLVVQSLQEQLEAQKEIESELRNELDIQLAQQADLLHDNEYLKQKLSAVQHDNSNYCNTQIRLETQLYSQEQDITNLQKEIQQLTKAKKDIEKQLMIESQDYENSKSIWQQNEVDLKNQIKSLNDVISKKQNADTKSPVNTATHHRELQISLLTIKTQDKLIQDLKSQIETHKKLLQDQQHHVQFQSLKLLKLESEIDNVKQSNISLQADNESYQILLHEKTMNGEFMMQLDDNLNVPKSSSSNTLNLAEELASSDWNPQKELESNQTIQKLTEENKLLQDTNRALQLYMNKILMKIINNKQLEDVLSIDQPKPISPPTSIKSSKSAKSDSSSRQRRRTISYWGKVPPQLPAPKPEKSFSTNNPTRSNTGGWTKALRRMSGWSSREEEDIKIKKSFTTNELHTLSEE